MLRWSPILVEVSNSQETDRALPNSPHDFRPGSSSLTAQVCIRGFYIAGVALRMSSEDFHSI